ncbi:cytochrome c biogenesis heme-transporting ATPase CcmA [Vibrio mangrovi]|uniref:Cytochrome c biogenesis ATP-binding export protein CcmA n=1 Tax=Vibrio mangrovi TaxID=474394 RepID=A0A1Y6IU36_9VIBR|nr:cytochrome c biogenesis heme-transporting ATPase CcmA [Vibrio mangrovi]MDW6001447.1 cytochrome c biogenesis heme-transporting ATPase CcmA [Vibrio mangrovi]SMS00531.1 Cytochrome c biogenesis ATP-binding export protein CcmA [Vibrio mangrovi]
MLEVKNVSAVRDERILFEALSFTVRPGNLIQIAGRNGAGKTTLLRMIAGLGDVEQGQILWDGISVCRNREHFYQHLLYLGHQTGIKRELSAYENLVFYQLLHQREVQQEAMYYALGRVGLAGKEDLPVSQLSAGQQRRVALARLWLSDHLLWVLDEPLTAIDKQGVHILENLFLEHIQRGGMIILTTHQTLLEEHPALKKIHLGEVV